MIKHEKRQLVNSDQLEGKMERGPSLRMYFNGKPFSGIERVTDKNGIIKGDYGYFDGYNDAVSWIYNPDGSLNYVLGYFNEQPHGIWRYYDENGFMWKEDVFYCQIRIRTKLYYKDGEMENSYEIENSPSEAKRYLRMRNGHEQNNRLVPSIQIPLEESYWKWERAMEAEREKNK